MKAIYQFKNDYLPKVNWTLLLFLVFVLNVKMPVKIAVIILLLLLNKKLFLEKNFYRQKFILFYFSLIVITLINVLLNIPSITVQYLVAVSVGIMFWLLCAGTAFLNSWFVAKTDTEKLHTTITLFFILNAVVTLVQLFLIILDAGSINPYTYQGMHQKYFIGTGDLMTGITFDVSTTNAILNAFGIVYFLQRSRMGLVLLCMMVLLLTASNFTNVLLLLVLVFLFVFQSNRDQKSIILVCFLLLVIFMSKISPQNDSYVKDAYNKIFNKKSEQKAKKKSNILLTEKPDSILNAEERKQKKAMLYLDSLNKITTEVKRKEDSLKHPGQKLPSVILSASKPSIPKPSIHTEPFQRRRDTSEFQKELLEFAIETVPAFDTSLKQTKSRKLPGKLIAFQQTISFLKDHPLKIFTGTGTGNFSSKLAFRATGLRMAGGYPKKFSYTNNDFLNNHLNLYLNYFSKDIELHSLVNSPNAVYDQLIAEYGVLGILAFILFYLAFFVKHLRKLSYGIPLLLLLLGSLGVEYWFEQLSIVIVFELLMLLNIKETKEQKWIQ
jgi:hypothetical protein